MRISKKILAIVMAILSSVLFLAPLATPLAVNAQTPDPLNMSREDWLLYLEDVFNSRGAEAWMTTAGFTYNWLPGYFDARQPEEGKITVEGKVLEVLVGWQVEAKGLYVAWPGCLTTDQPDRVKTTVNTRKIRAAENSESYLYTEAAVTGNGEVTVYADCRDWSQLAEVGTTADTPTPTLAVDSQSTPIPTLVPPAAPNATPIPPTAGAPVVNPTTMAPVNNPSPSPSPEPEVPAVVEPPNNGGPSWWVTFTPDWWGIIATICAIALVSATAALLSFQFITGGIVKKIFMVGLAVLSLIWFLLAWATLGIWTAMIGLAILDVLTLLALGALWLIHGFWVSLFGGHNNGNTVGIIGTILGVFGLPQVGGFFATVFSLLAGIPLAIWGVIMTILGGILSCLASVFPPLAMICGVACLGPVIVLVLFIIWKKMIVPTGQRIGNAWANRPTWMGGPAAPAAPAPTATATAAAAAPTTP